MTLNGVIALPLRYFTEFVYNVVVKQLGLRRFQNILLLLYDPINTICAIILVQRSPRNEAIVCWCWLIIPAAIGTALSISVLVIH